MITCKALVMVVDEPATTFLGRILSARRARKDENAEWQRRDAASIRRIYAQAAHVGLDRRNPIVFIPGIMGSRLVDPRSAKFVWGEFDRSRADLKRPDSRRMIALPMEQGQTLDRLASPTGADGTLQVAGFRRLPITVGVYRDMLATFGSIGAGDGDRPDFVDGGLFGAFEFGYDWRRSLDETARSLGDFLRMATDFVQAKRGRADPVQFDVVAHSMGGLVLLYYLRFGARLLPTDGSRLRVTWAGAERVARAVIIGTPNAGSAAAMTRLVSGLPATPLVHPGYDPQLIGTMPASYQLLPRMRHDPFRDHTGAARDIFDPATWIDRQWGLADGSAAADARLALQLPGVDSAGERRAIALDHLDKCLAMAAALHRALDEPAARPRELELHAIVGDGRETAITMTGDRGTGTVRPVRFAAGDGTVPRSSALMDERMDGHWTRGLKSPMSWDSITFANSEHMALARDRAVINNTLFKLLDAPGLAQA